MIRLHKLNGQEVVVNAELIESIEPHANTVICLATGNRIIVTESVTDVISSIVNYRKVVNQGQSALPEMLRGGQEKERKVCH